MTLPRRAPQSAHQQARELIARRELPLALQLLARAVASEPEDVEAQRLLAHARYMLGEEDFLRDLTRAAASRPGAVPLRLALADLQRGAGLLHEAEDGVRSLIRERGWTPGLGSALAVVLQEQGRYEPASREARVALAARPVDAALVANLVAIELARGEPAPVRSMIREMQLRSPFDQRWYAYECIAARLQGDPRYAELVDYERMVAVIDLPCPRGWRDRNGFHADLERVLTERHVLRRAPLDQSVRGGTQTQGNLLDDADAVIQALVASLTAAVGEFRAGLPRDADHPFYARNRGPAALAGCWSVRLGAGGHHVNHLHPRGWISSAYYVAVPDQGGAENEHAGWLKFGEPRHAAPGLGPDRYVEPRPGRLVLFPSYFWHGTVPSRGATPRLSVAFDALPRTALEFHPTARALAE